MPTVYVGGLIGTALVVKDQRDYWSKPYFGSRYSYIGVNICIAAVSAYLFMLAREKPNIVEFLIPNIVMSVFV